MSNMVTYTALVAEDETEVARVPNRFILVGLRPFDRMKVLLEQAIYCDYLLAVCSSTTSITELHQNISKMRGYLDDEIHGSDEVANTLYKSGLDIFDKIMHHRYDDLCTLQVATDLRAIFTTPVCEKYWYSLYTPTITDTFLTEWLSFKVGWISNDLYPDHNLTESAIYIPSLALADFRDRLDQPENLQVCMTLRPISVAGYNLQVPRANYTPGREGLYLSDFIKRFNLRDLSVDEIIGIYASFAIDHDNYVIANATGCVVTMAGVCYDVITGSSYTSDDLDAGSNIADKGDWINLLRTMVQEGRLQKVHNNRLFGDLLTRMGVDSDTVNYFTKNITQISTREASAFRNSVFSSVAGDKFIAGTEADDEPYEDDQADDTVASTDDTDEGTGDISEDDTSLGMDDTEDTSTEDQQPDVEKVKPQIDPEKMLLELAAPNNNQLSGYLYRRVVAERLDNLINQPPQNARPSDILMLKRWRANWLYLVSIACLRDFLTRISLRLSK